jgi:hypothetical protein
VIHAVGWGIGVVVVLMSAVLYQEADPASDHTGERPPPRYTIVVQYAPYPSPRAVATEEPTPMPTILPTPAKSLPNVPRDNLSPAIGTLDAATVREFARMAGFPEWTLDTAVAIARCESGFRPNATGSQGEMGLWQIHPRWHSDATYDPLGNAKAAYRISDGGTDWGAWSCAG